MKIQIKLSNKEKENYRKICRLLDTEPKEDEKGQWGYIKDGDININEGCVLDATDLIIATIPKIKSLIIFVQSLFPIIKESANAFADKWIDKPKIEEIEEDKKIKPSKVAKKNEKKK